MTATEIDRVRSDNFVSREATVTPETDPRLRRIVQLATYPDGLTTRNDSTINSGLPLNAVGEYLGWLCQDNNGQVLAERQTMIGLLIGQGDVLTEGIF